MDFDRVSMQSGGVRLFERPGSDIRMTGYLKKLKTMKKKFFVLRSTSSSGPARLEYYDSEKKFNAGHLPKRSVHLHTCFNINRKSDSRHKNSIALYTKEECFSVICENEKEQENWLSMMLEYQNEYVHDGERSREHYEYVWQVSVQPKGLGQTMNIKGSYRLCLTRHNICLVKLNTDKPQYIFQLETVRSLAHNDNLFRMEVGKIAPTGEGELWMQADDAVIAQNLHETILNFMKNMDRRFDLHDTRRTDSMHGSSSTLPRPSEFRHRTSSETFTQGSGRNRAKVDRPMSVYTGTARSTSHLHNSTVSPGTSPHTHGFTDHQIVGSHRLRSDSNDSKTSRTSMSGMSDDIMHDMHNLSLLGPSGDIMPLEEEEPEFDVSSGVDHRSVPSSPGSHLAEQDEYDGQGEGYMEMTPGSVTPPTPGNSGYIDMGPLTHKESREGWPEQGSSYVPMNPSWSSSSSAPIPIHPAHSDHGLGYMEMSTHNPLPPVKEGGSTEGYLPMSPSYSASPSGSSSQLRPDRVACMLSDDGSDFSQPPTRTYSLGSRPVKTGAPYSGYVDMSGRSKGVSDNGRSCSAPHLINHHHHHHHRNNSRNSNLDSPTPSASPLSMSLRSDDSDSFMELDFYRPRTASDSYSYRPRASSFGMQQSALGQGHRPRSSSHGQGTRPLRRHKILGMVDSPGRLNHEMLHRSHNSSSHGSFDSLKVSSSESLKKLSQEVRTKTSQLNSSGYMDMSFEKRHTPSPQPGSAASSRSGQSGQNGYVDMTLGNRKTSPNRNKLGSRSNSKTSSSEKLQDSDYTNMSLGSTGCSSSAPTTDSAYINFESQDGPGKKDAPSRSSSAENVDAYIMYEPATTPTGSGGKGAIPKGESTSPDPRSRSGSGGKDHKKRSFFSLRHGSNDSSKHNAKKGESSQQAGGMISYSSTGGEKFGSLGRDIRQKSKDAKSGARKSSSFSRTFGISTTKPGKLSRKTPTPPKSLDGNDEYIEFSPMAVKSDSDSSHSSGSTKSSRARQESIGAKQEAEYVGFEPGNITASSSGQKGSGTTSGYVPMNAGSGGSVGHGAVFKPVKKSGTRRSKSKEECSQVMSAITPTSPNPPSLGEEKDKPIAKPVPLYPSRSDHQPPPSPVTTTTTIITTPTTTPSTAQAAVDLSGGGEKRTSSTAAMPTSTAVSPSTDYIMSSPQSSSTSSFVTVTKPSPILSTEGGYMDFDPSKPTTDSSAHCSNAPTGLDIVKPAIVKSYITDSSTTKTTAATTSKSSSSRPATSPVKTSSSNPGKSSSAEKTSTGKTNTSSADYEEISPTSPSSFTSVPSSSRSKKPSGGRTRKSSGDKPSSSDGNGSAKTATEQCPPKDPSDTTNTGCGTTSGSGNLAEGGQSGNGSKSKEGCSPRLSQGSSPGNSQQGLTRPESTPCMLSIDKPTTAGRGRGRHSSSSSTGAGQPRKGKNNGNNNNNSNNGSNSNNRDSNGNKGDGGMLQINSETEARHSITDLSGYEQMSFPSNALSRQQPAHFHSRQQQPSLTSSQGSGSTCGSQGVLNYATLDLGSADSMGDSGDATRSPRNKSRHPSAAEEKGEPLSYATIDFEKSESLRCASGKDTKLTL